MGHELFQAFRPAAITVWGNNDVHERHVRRRWVWRPLPRVAATAVL